MSGHPDLPSLHAVFQDDLANILVPVALHNADDELTTDCRITTSHLLDCLRIPTEGCRQQLLFCQFRRKE
jgi:hypothetical protein